MLRKQSYFSEIKLPDWFATATKRLVASNKLLVATTKRLKLLQLNVWLLQQNGWLLYSTVRYGKMFVC